jgi:hypothetical protein
MKHLSKNIQCGLTILVAAGAFAFSGAVAPASGQDKNEAKRETSASRAGRDPFSKYVPPRVIVRKSGLVMPPSIQERIRQYKAQKQAAMSARVPAPKPTTAFLLNEMQVVGISRSPRGYAAIVEATPIKLAYVIYPGEKFYDGQLVAIEDSRLVFRREMVFSDGKRDRSVEIKPLRQPSAVETMAALKAAPANSAPAESEKKSDERPATEKP